MFNSYKFIVTKLVCRDYGFDCEFVVENEDNSVVIAGFGKHMDEEHGIEYTSLKYPDLVASLWGRRITPDWGCR